ncbi:diguanylate cyclase [Natronospora cellulosivora (SeqCode)]
MSKKEKLDLVDSLTGLKNYQAFIDDIEEKIKEAEENCQDLSLASVDIDSFMRVNENYGNKAGDKVLIFIANQLEENMPAEAKIYRYSGDQFAVIMSDTIKEKAFLLLEGVREKLANQGVKIREDMENLDITVSIGIAAYPEDGSNSTELVRKAEGALYRAKNSGRNKVRLSREEKMVTKTSHYTYEQLQRLSELAKKEGVGEAVLLREALDDLLKKYDD